MAETGRTKEDWVGGSFGLVVVMPIALSLICGFLIFAVRCFVWLSSAVWPIAPTVHDGLNDLAGRPISLTTGALGLDKIVTGLVDYLPLEVGLIVILPIIWLVMWIKIYELLFYRSKNKK